MIRLTIDTNTYSQVFENIPHYAQAVSQAEAIYIPTIVIGELYYGFALGTKEEQNKRLLEDFLEAPQVKIIQVSKKTAHNYALISQQLKQNGTPIPTNDIWIAAAALETNSTLLTRDTHFSHVPDLKVLNFT